MDQPDAAYPALYTDTIKHSTTATSEKQKISLISHSEHKVNIYSGV